MIKTAPSALKKHFDNDIKNVKHSVMQKLVDEKKISQSVYDTLKKQKIKYNKGKKVVPKPSSVESVFIDGTEFKVGKNMILTDTKTFHHADGQSSKKPKIVAGKVLSITDKSIVIDAHQGTISKLNDYGSDVRIWTPSDKTKKVSIARTKRNQLRGINNTGNWNGKRVTFKAYNIDPNM